MKLYKDIYKRGTGGTARLLNLARETGATYVGLDLHHVSQYSTIVKMMTFKEFLTRGVNHKNELFVIDNLDLLLEKYSENTKNQELDLTHMVGYSIGYENNEKECA